MTATTLRAGFIGLGAMGEPMARNLAKAGLLAAVWNRSSGKAAALAAELGVHAATAPEELTARVDVVMLCVSADRDVLEMIGRIAPALRPGTVVIDFSTVGSASAVEAARQVREKEADFLDAPVTGGVEGARNGKLAIMIGGREETLERVRPLLEPLAARVVHMGDNGQGQATKAVNQIMCAGINQAVTEALAFGARLHLDPDKLIEVLSGGAAGNWFLEKRGPTMMRGTFQPGFKLALHHKDLGICQAMAENLETRLPLVDTTFDDYARLMEEGHGDEDISVLYRLKRP